MSTPNRPFTIGLIGNPNCGKTTVFNALTGSKQYIGNWPGVTVERKSGSLKLLDGQTIEIVDLPGIYSLVAVSEDERVAVDYVLAKEADLFINVIDGTNLERNLYLTLLLSELGVPMLHVITMLDLVEDRGMQIDFQHLQMHLGSPVVGVNLARKEDQKKLLKAIADARDNPLSPKLKITYHNEVEVEIEALSKAIQPVAEVWHVSPRWAAIRLLEGDDALTHEAVSAGVLSASAAEEASQRITRILKEFPDESLAEARYGIIQGLCHDVVGKIPVQEHFTQKADRIILNRWLGIPCFLLVMYIVFWITQVVGGAFIDFFEVLGSTLFVEGPTALLTHLGAPPFVVALLAKGLGAGLQTMATFLPPIFLMFFCLSILEDSGYMARAAFVMDRFMRWLGLPGKSFVPLLVGFGCSVPAIMATRALSSRRDRFLTIFMTPFMSCGAKLPVYVVFGAAFFPENPGHLVFLIYLSGMLLGILTGLLLKKTLFTGAPSHFIMELPPYHLPRLKHICLHAWDRLKIFVFRAGKVIVPMVLILGVLNSIDLHGTFGHEDSNRSVLATMATAITPAFEPMGVEAENWPATVAIFSGLFAKEAVIGTMTSLYGQNATEGAPLEPTPKFHFGRGIQAALQTIPEGFKKIGHSLLHPFGLSERPEADSLQQTVAETDPSLFERMREAFPQGRHQAFAYLLFILLYVPCLAAMGTAFNELGKFYGTVMAIYLTLLGWSVATLYFQITVAHQPLWIGLPCLILLGLIGSFYFMGKHRKINYL